MNTLGKASSWLVLLLIGGQLAGAEPSRDTSQPVATQQGEQNVAVTVDKAVSIAIGESAVANTRIANTPAQSVGDGEVTVRVGTIYRRAVGPNASACIQIPFVEDAGTCN